MKLKAVNINKSYVKEKHRLNIIENFSCEIGSGELWLFKGASGCGKTTLLSILGLIDKPDSGELLLGDVPVLFRKRREIEAMRRTLIGFVFQEANLLERLTIRENLLLTLEGSSYNKTEAAGQAEKILQTVGLGDRAGHYPFELSGGEKQRVSFARAVMKQPELLICDEPTASLDRTNADKIREMLLDMKRKGCSVLVSSHTADFDDIADTVIQVGKE